MRRRPLVVQTMEDAVYEAIREDILAGLEPGTPLRLANFADRLGVSTMPVRAALIRLESEGMIRQIPRHGAVVAPLDYEDFEALQALRIGIEGLAARAGASKLSDRDLQQAGKVLAAAETSAQQGKTADYLRLANELHDICYRASGRPQLMRLVDEHRRPAERYLRRIVQAKPNLDDSIGFQRRFYAACLAHDAAGAESAIRDALHWSLEHVAAMLVARDSAEQTEADGPGARRSPSGRPQRPRARR
jgi:DNA-binding GntR family transcriptional regulator